MKMYLPFGDWSDDGHGKYHNILIDAPSMQHLRDAQIRIEEKYGKDFWEGFAERYGESTIDDRVQSALIDAKYPLERFLEKIDTCDFDEYQCLEDIFDSEDWQEDYGCYMPFEAIVDTFIWLLNAHGAQIARLDESNGIPTICNWTCHGFKTVGYGCFD